VAVARVMAIRVAIREIPIELRSAAGNWSPWKIPV
jgi:hypothetical protein